MYARKNQLHLPAVFCALGLAGLTLRKLLFALALDDKGLLVTGHPLELLLWLLAAGVLALAVLNARKLAGAEEQQTQLPSSAAALAGQLLGAAGICATVLMHEPKMPGGLGTAWTVLGYASVPCLTAAAILRFCRKRPFFLLYMVPCLFLVVHLVNHYQTWSSDPQLQNYAFALLGVVPVMLFAFYSGAWEAEIRRPDMLMGTGLAAAAFTLMALPDCAYPWLYLGGCIWTATGLPAGRPKRNQEEVKS